MNAKKSLIRQQEQVCTRLHSHTAVVWKEKNLHLFCLLQIFSENLKSCLIFLISENVKNKMLANFFLSKLWLEVSVFSIVPYVVLLNTILAFDS